MSEGHASAQRINQSLTGDPLLLHRVDSSQLQAQVNIVNGYAEEHPADENQVRGLDHLAGPSYLSSVTRWLVAGVVFCLLAMAQVFMGDQL